MTGERAGLARWEGEPVDAWERAWGVPLMEAFERLSSTNDRLRELADRDAPAFVVVVAEEQTAGRGREGRAWSSPPGLGLWMSVLVRLESEIPPTLLPLLVGVAVCRAIRAVCPDLEPLLKWPNDVMLGRRKVCGILCEGIGLGKVVIGIGTNVRQRAEDFPPELRALAVSLEVAGREPVGRALLAGHLVRSLKELVSDLPSRLEGPLAHEVAGLDALLGTRVRDVSGGEGIAQGIASDGALRVRVDGGTERRLVAGGVTIVGGLD